MSAERSLNREEHSLALRMVNRAFPGMEREAIEARIALVRTIKTMQRRGVSETGDTRPIPIVGIVRQATLRKKMLAEQLGEEAT